MSLRGYILRRLAYTFVLVLFVILVNWIIFQAMPNAVGGIAALQGQQSKNGVSNTAAIERLNALYGLNQPPLTRFVNYFKAMLTFNFGVSFNGQHPVLQDIISSGRLENTLLLLGSSTALALVIGVLLGVVVSSRRGTSIDSFWVTTSLTTFSLPVFWMGLIFITVFSSALKWFPSGGVSIPPPLPPWPQYILERLQHLFLPMLTLTLFFYGGFLLLTRATMLESLNEDFITTAKAKGLKGRAILFKHALKPASLPIVTSAALSFGTILGGAIITETIFNWDGLGLFLYNAILTKDLPIMQAMFYILALSVIAANFISDLLYGIIDPRVRYQ